MPATVPRILFWEWADDRVQRVVAAPGSNFRPVVLGQDSTRDGVMVMSAREITASWSERTPISRPRTDVELAAAAVGLGLVDGAVGGVATSSADVLRAGLRYVGANGTVSCAMIATPPASLPWGRRIMLADVAVVRRPTPGQLADIAIASADSWQRATHEAAHVAFVAATTKSREDTGEVDVVRTALALVRDRRPDLDVDGELQVDAALVAEVARQKLADPDRRPWVPANILVFPDLVSANAGYKLLQHLAGYTMTSFTQQLIRPFCDVSRGCTVEELHAAVEQCVSQVRYGPCSQEVS